MVLLGLRTKTHKPLTVHFDYAIQIKGIKPWPPSRALRTLRAVSIQWNLGGDLSGSTPEAAPSLGSDSDGRIEFNESIRLSATLKRELSVVNGKNGYTFQKRSMELNLYEPRRDRATKAQLLGTAVLDLSEYAVERECVSVSLPLNCRRSYGNTVQPFLYLDIQSFPRQRLDSYLTREPSAEINGAESVSESELMGDEYAEEESEAFGSSGSSSSPQLSVTSNGPEKDSKKSMKLEQQFYNVEDSSASAADVDSHRHVYTKFGFFLSHPQEDDEEDDGHALSPDSDSFVMSEIIDTKEKQESVRANDGDEPLSDSSRNDSPKPTTNLSSSGSIKSNPFIVADIETNARDPLSSMRRDANLLLEGKIQQLEQSMEALKAELKLAAGIEISLYSVTAEHGSSSSVKVHAPARRLSRLYFHAEKQRGLTVSNSIVNGLVTAAKACGTDVPRLTFWLSNAVVLRAVMSSRRLPLSEDFKADEKTPLRFVAALEDVEKWIFSRIVESLWWQIFTPHMQSVEAELISKSIGAISSNDRRRGNYSVELWKRVFGYANEKICPLRAQGRECGCLPALSKLIMEQLIARLDVAMFNAILRESAEDIPTDPLADPISDPYVLPIQTGKASFGSGAQLKNAIGNWRAWLAENGYIQENDDDSPEYFRLLASLSDLMMLPKDMLLSRTIRKEVCPMFGPHLIRRVLNSFVPDEFCPEPIPEVVLEDLNSEDPYDNDNGEDYITIFPCASPPMTYHAPSADSIARTTKGIGDNSDSKSRNDGRSFLEKSQTSDDELEELESPVNRIISSHSSKDEESCEYSTVRYRLLREAWMNDK